MIHRRMFLQAMLAGPVLGRLPTVAATERPDALTEGFGPLYKDPNNLLHLPKGFSYHIVSRAGQTMNDGLKVPGWPDGMHAYALDDQRVALLCNHELAIQQSVLSAWQDTRTPTADEQSRIYDSVNGTPIPGAVRRLIVNLHTGKLEGQYLVLAGTLRNCSGGVTPWRSWLSCEESVDRSGQLGLQQDHGYCFEVPLDAEGLVNAVPLKAMGRFNHEAAGVDPRTGIVYLTEDRPDSLFYRFIPDHPQKLARGGRLQALALIGSTSVSTGNREGEAVFPQRKRLPVRWVDLEDVESPRDDLRHQGADKGAARFVRGEGLLVETGKSGTQVWFVCTSGGRIGFGQVFRYFPSPAEGAAEEQRTPGQLELYAETDNPQLMALVDNLTRMPNGDLILCEDHESTQRLIGLTDAGRYYRIAINPRAASEFTGPTFSPDGSTLFVNMQQQGLTLAIRGPWHSKV